MSALANTPRRPFSQLEVVGRTADGFTVWDRYNSHCHLERALLREALSRVEFGAAAFAKRMVEFERPVARNDCVATTDTDEIVYALRPNRHGYTRFVLGRGSEPTRTISLILKLKEADAKALVLISAYAGVAEPEPWDRHATPESAKFWETHALRWGCCEVSVESLRLRCPRHYRDIDFFAAVTSEPVKPQPTA